MMGLVIFIHVAVCITLIVIVLIQRGKGGGLLESFSGIESMFGTKTSAFLTRTTTVLAVIFFFSCLVLAILSVKKSKSLMPNIKPKQSDSQPLSRGAEQPQTPEQIPAVAEKSARAASSEEKKSQNDIQQQAPQAVGQEQKQNEQKNK